MPRADRRVAEARGRQAERRAALWLRMKGYSILATRVKLPVGEVDIIARQGKLIAFVEVKARARRDGALGAVTPATWQRIAGVAEAWIASRPEYTALRRRYDLIALAPGRLPQHLADVWRPGLA